jgi:hypothetical protein
VENVGAILMRFRIEPFTLDDGRTKFPVTVHGYYHHQVPAVAKLHTIASPEFRKRPPEALLYFNVDLANEFDCPHMINSVGMYVQLASSASGFRAGITNYFYF